LQNSKRRGHNTVQLERRRVDPQPIAVTVGEQCPDIRAGRYLQFRYRFLSASNITQGPSKIGRLVASFNDHRNLETHINHFTEKHTLIGHSMLFFCFQDKYQATVEFKRFKSSAV